MIVSDKCPFCGNMVSLVIESVSNERQYLNIVPLIEAAVANPDAPEDMVFMVLICPLDDTETSITVAHLRQKSPPSADRQQPKMNTSKLLKVKG